GHVPGDDGHLAGCHSALPAYGAQQPGGRRAMNANAFWAWAQRRSSLTLALYAGLVYVFFYTPIAIVVAYSFNDSRFVSVWGGFTTRWYGVAFSDSSITDALRITLIVA